MISFQKHTNSKGEVILYLGNPNLQILEEVSHGYGDIWHSSLDQGFLNFFPEIRFQTATFWYINDVTDKDECVNWRINPNQFAIRESVWNFFDGFDLQYKTRIMQALDYGYNSLCYRGVIPLYKKDLFGKEKSKIDPILLVDIFVFYFRNFKKIQAFYVFFRLGVYKPRVILAFFKAKNTTKVKGKETIFPPRILEPIAGKPTVSYILPTMLRQNFTLTLLNDLVNQSYLVSQVIVVDATPADKRNESLYKPDKYPFEVIFKWQESKGSCRARNEAIDLCTSDYIIFGDDDIRLTPDFVENHIRLLQTYNAVACNGLDVLADNASQNLEDLNKKLKRIEFYKKRAGVATNFSNANSCVRRDYVTKLVGNDINYDGGYGEDSDFGISLYKLGTVVLYNSFSGNLHLKPLVGGYRFWGKQAKITGKKRKIQPWELDNPVRNIIPVPSPTITYQVLKHFNKSQLKEYKYNYFLRFLVSGSILLLPFRLVQLPLKIIKFNKSIFYAKKLLALGKRTK